ncbi:hypothetical protein [Fusibacter sp. JL216-2]|uniref:hypothetical protein n=1 Tax=Fusibacter sp. JL216-2 TaxID=3071453 RepID=UPI003D3518F4
MQHEVKKITLIINELLTMFLLNGGQEIDMKVKRIDGETEIVLEHHNCTYDEAFIERLEHNLNTMRQFEVEGYYWQLVGEDESADELYLVGAMVDEADVSCENGELKIRLLRKENSKG